MSPLKESVDEYYAYGGKKLFCILYDDKLSNQMVKITKVSTCNTKAFGSRCLFVLIFFQKYIL